MDEMFIDIGDGTRINALHYTTPNSKGVMFYFKGNTRSIKGWGKFSKDFISKNYDFFLIDYPGFGKSKGKRTEARIYLSTLINGFVKGILRRRSSFMVVL